MDGEIEDEI